MRTLLICLLAPAAIMAQGNPLSTYHKGVYGEVNKILIRAAEKMPEEHYGFKPTAAVRSYGQLVGHMADAQYVFCSIVLGEKNPAPKVEQTKTSKTGLIAALNDAFAYCDKAFGGMTDASAAEMVRLFGEETPKLGVMTINLMHNLEHYGNMVTYLRMKDIVPPTSEPRSSPQPKK